MLNDEVFASEGGNIESRFLYIAPEVRFDCSLKNQNYSWFWPDWRQSRKKDFAKTSGGLFGPVCILRFKKRQKILICQIECRMYMYCHEWGQSPRRNILCIVRIGGTYGGVGCIYIAHIV
jgi:hypothetical protein